MIGVGVKNLVSGNNSVILSGFENEVSGDSSIILGGSNNTISGNLSFAFGDEMTISNDHVIALFGSDRTGTVGINTESPDEALHVVGTAKIEDILLLVPRADEPDPPSDGMIYASTDGHLYFYYDGDWKQLDNP